MNKGEEEKMERVFGGWLRWSSEREVLLLLELVVSQLQRRGYSLRVEIEPPKNANQ